MCEMRVVLAVSPRWSVKIGGNEENLEIWKGKEESKSGLERRAYCLGLGENSNTFKKFICLQIFWVTFMFF